MAAESKSLHVLVNINVICVNILLIENNVYKNIIVAILARNLSHAINVIIVLHESNI